MSMLPVFTIIGRPNVGKSTLFNALTESRDALVADFPGVTRDRQYGEGQINKQRFIVVDTGGISEFTDNPLGKLTEQQVQQAIEESDRLLFVVDAKIGLTTADQEIAKKLRSHQKKVVLVVNKIDGMDPDIVMSDFYALGFQQIFPIAAKSRRGINTMMMELIKLFPSEESTTDQEQQGIVITIAGRPNVGKSTLVNRLLGEERVIVFDQPGTTRDSIFIPFERRGVKYTLVDTAGVRRRAKVTDVIEKFSVIKTMQAIARAQVIIVVMNAQEGILEQDLRLLGLVIKMGKPFVIAVNKWDGLGDYEREQVKAAMDRLLRFASFARRYFISAQHGTGVGKLYHAIHEAHQSATKEFSTSELTEVLEGAVEDHQPPAVQGRRIRLRYAHLGGHDPLNIVIHGKQLNSLPISYQHYLSNYYRKAFKLVGVPIQITYKNDRNPYVE